MQAHMPPFKTVDIAGARERDAGRETTMQEFVDNANNVEDLKRENARLKRLLEAKQLRDENAQLRRNLQEPTPLRRDPGLTLDQAEMHRLLTTPRFFC